MELGQFLQVRSSQQLLSSARFAQVPLLGPGLVVPAIAQIGRRWESSPEAMPALIRTNSSPPNPRVHLHPSPPPPNPGDALNAASCRSSRTGSLRHIGSAPPTLFAIVLAVPANPTRGTSYTTDPRLLQPVPPTGPRQPSSSSRTSRRSSPMLKKKTKSCGRMPPRPEEQQQERLRQQLAQQQQHQQTEQPHQQQHHCHHLPSLQEPSRPTVMPSRPRSPPWTPPSKDI